MTQDSAADLIYDWNQHLAAQKTSRLPELFDESLRDGIQSPSVVDPPLALKIQHLHLLDRLGVQAIDIGLPGAGPRAYSDVRALAKEIVDQKLSLRPACAGRTLEADIVPIIRVSEEVGIPIEVYCFLGSSPIRALAESWDESLLEKRTAESVALARKNKLPVTFVTEDTIRSKPSTLERLFKAAIQEGVTGLCLCDTVGHATEEGTRALIEWTKSLVESTGAEVRLDWHGHND